MTKKFLWIWSIVLLALFVLYFIYSNNTKRIVYEKEFLLPEHLVKTFSANLLDSAFVDNEFLILTVTMDDCDVCKAILLNDCYKRAFCDKFFFNVSASSENETLAHLLYTKGFPTTYVVNNSYELLGILEGIRNLGEKLDSVLYCGEKINDCHIEGISSDSIVPMLSNALRAFVCLEKGDDAHACRWLDASLKSGSYVYNNYLSYLFAKKEGLRDSARFKDRVLSFRGDLDHVIYKKIIHQLK